MLRSALEHLKPIIYFSFSCLEAFSGKNNKNTRHYYMKREQGYRWCLKIICNMEIFSGPSGMRFAFIKTVYEKYIIVTFNTIKIILAHSRHWTDYTIEHYYTNGNCFKSVHCCLFLFFLSDVVKCISTW